MNNIWRKQQLKSRYAFTTNADTFGIYCMFSVQKLQVEMLLWSFTGLTKRPSNYFSVYSALC